MSSPRFQLPEAALIWLTSPSPVRVLTLGGAPVARTLAAAGHDVFAIDKSTSVVAGLSQVAGITAVIAQAESLPFHPCQFDVVLAHQSFDRFAPGLVLSEMARVLRPEGTAALSFLVRDDSVPWVRRLIAQVQSLDPDAMKGDFGHASIEQLTDSKYFLDHEQKDYRHWVPLRRQGMLDMVRALPAVQGLAENDRADFLADISDLYDDAAPGAEPLRLPYLLRCVRARVNHEELTAPIQIDDDGLVIPL